MQVSIDSLFNTDGTPKATTSTATEEKSGSELDKSDFLNLLVKQLQYQDPLEPQSNSDQAAQLAQFSALEAMQDIKTAISDQTTELKSAVSSLQYSALSTTNATSVSLIGKTVKLQQDELLYADAEVSFNVHLGTQSQATVSLLDEDGTAVKTFVASDKDATNSVTLTWDGLTDQGTTAESGSYTIQIEGAEDDDQLYCAVEGRVNGVRLTDSGPVVKIDGQEMSISKILEVAES
jgi:flagellar basal-body rod modification protein FlgD